MRDKKAGSHEVEIKLIFVGTKGGYKDLQGEQELLGRVDEKRNAER